MAPTKCPRCYRNNLDDGITGDTYCTDCGWNKIMQHELDTLKAHALDVQTLLKRDPTTVKLIVGLEKTALVYNRAVLAYRSKMLDAAFFDGFQESVNGEMEMPEDDVKEMMVFGLWAQSGVISLESVYGNSYKDPADVDAYPVSDGEESENDPDDEAPQYFVTTLARLWVLGNKILAIGFCNAIMRILIKEIGNTNKWQLSYTTVRYIFDHTLPQSKFRRFLLDRIQAKGPFTEDDYHGHYDGWLGLLEEGGDLVRECSAMKGFHNREPSLYPSHTRNHHKYMEDESTQPSAEAWRDGEF